MMYHELLLYHHRNRYIHWFLECLQGLYKCRAGRITMAHIQMYVEWTHV